MGYYGDRHGVRSGVKVELDKRTQRFINGLDSAKSKAAADGIELTSEEAAKAAMKKLSAPRK